MKSPNKKGLDIIIDKLTNSIENVKSGDSFSTEISLLKKEDIKLITKKMVGDLIGLLNIKC